MASMVDYVGAFPRVEVVAGTVASDYTVSNTTTFSDVTGLCVPLKANSMYQVHYLFTNRATAAADMKLRFTSPSGAVHRFSDTSQPTGSGNIFEGVNNETMNGSDTDDRILFGVIQVVTSSTAGDLQVQIAQVAAQVSDCTMRAGSCLVAVRVS